MTTDNKEKIRLNRFIANCGICSRRKADDLILSGKITVNKKIIKELGTKINPLKDKVFYNNNLLSNEKKIYILLNKPKGYISAVSDDKHSNTIIDLVNIKERVYPIGRLDKNTTGLIVLTNDGNFAKKLSHPSSNISKQYIVRLRTPISEEDYNKISAGLELEDGFFKFDKLEVLNFDYDTFKIVIHSGKNRIIRRMFEHLGYRIASLDRNKYMNLTKKGLPRKKWRFLNQKELHFFKMIK